MRTFDENYPDPEPVGYCPSCGEPIYAGDEAWETPDGLVHADYLHCGEYGAAGHYAMVPCMLYWLLEEYSPDEIAEALKFQRKVW